MWMKFFLTDITQTELAPEMVWKFLPPPFFLNASCTPTILPLTRLTFQFSKWGLQQGGSCFLLPFLCAKEHKRKLDHGDGLASKVKSWLDTDSGGGW